MLALSNTDWDNKLRPRCPSLSPLSLCEAIRKRSSLCSSLTWCFDGAANRNRTRNPLITNQLRYQLRHGGISYSVWCFADEKQPANHQTIAKKEQALFRRLILTHFTSPRYALAVKAHHECSCAQEAFSFSDAHDQGTSTPVPSKAGTKLSLAAPPSCQK